VSEWISPWNWTTADWAGLQFAVLVAAAIVAWRQVREAVHAREERTRPFVVIDLRVYQTIAEFTITNLGATIARNVRFAFDPPLRSSRDLGPNMTPLSETNLFRHGIPSLAPGKEVVALFDQLPHRLAQGNLPDDYEVTVTYEGPTRRKPYSETMTVGYSYLREVGRTHRRDIHDVHRELERVSREVRKWTAVGSGLKVMTPTDIEAYWEKIERERAQRRDEAEPDEVEQLGAEGMTRPGGSKEADRPISEIGEDLPS
jgi:hypothetical protein